jgi:hypothetical protein
MRKILNECVSCPPELGCIGTACPYSNITQYCCDVCNTETKLYYTDDDRELCEECLLNEFKVVEGSDYY